MDFGQGVLHVTRLKHGVPSVHPLGGQELRALRRLWREQPEGRHLFQTERNAPMTPACFRKTLTRIGEASPVAFPVHPHMLRHACGFKLANDGQHTRALQHYLGHRSIRHTVRYTELAADRFKVFGRIDRDRDGRLCHPRGAAGPFGPKMRQGVGSATGPVGPVGPNLDPSTSRSPLLCGHTAKRTTPIFSSAMAKNGLVGPVPEASIALTVRAGGN